MAAVVIESDGRSRGAFCPVGATFVRLRGPVGGGVLTGAVDEDSGGDVRIGVAAVGRPLFAGEAEEDEASRV